MNGGPLVVVGDVLLDVDVLASAERLVPDAPAPVLDELDRNHRAGGAALAARLAAEGTNRPVVLVAAVPDDSAGRRLRELLPPQIALHALPCRGRTPEKTRLRAGRQTVARLDRNAAGPELLDVPDTLHELLHDAAAVLVSDYGTGVTRDERLRELLAGRAAAGSVVWDPHPRGGEPVTNATVVTPNASEAGCHQHALPEVRRRAEALLAVWRVRSVAITLGVRGALLSYGTGSSELFPAPPTADGDACGAGDCFAATVASVLADGGVPREAVAAAVATASAFVAAGGAAGLDRVAAAPAFRQPDAVRLAAEVRARGGTVVATGGCFDLLHAGHIATLRAARSLGDCLIVCLNSDASVQRLKGAGRPLQPAADRAQVLDALADVDAVAIFEEDTPLRMLARLRPDVWVKGGDYAGVELPESRLLADWGGEVVTVPYLSGRSTSELVARAR